MAIIKKGYLCSNLQGKCEVALSHEILYYSASEATCPACGSKLESTGKTKLNFAVIASSLLSVFAVTVGGYYGFKYLNPEPITGIYFQTAVSEIAEEAAVAQIKVVRDNAESSVELTYITEAITATPEVDYKEKSGVISFAAEQHEVTINIPIIPDRDAMESNETFHIILNGVQGEQTHTVVIIEKGVDQNLLDNSEVVISELSVLAADIANDMTSVKAYQDYFNNSMSNDEALLQKYQQLTENLNSARDRYLLQLNKAIKLDPSVVAKIVENRLSVLKRENAELQYIATQVMHQHLKEYRETNIPTADSWMEELSNLVILDENGDRKYQSI